MMFKQLLSVLVLGLASAPAIVSSHQALTNIHINGVNQGLGRCLRIPPSTAPVKDVYSTDMVCNVGGLKPVARACPIDAGATITLVWRAWPDGTVPGSIDISHQGPCAVYMKKVPDATTARGDGDGWFKIYHEGYRNGKFCSQRIADNNGKLTVRIPRDLEGGDYLLRGETLALHQAQTRGGAQWYMGCAQLIVSSTGGRARPKTFAIPGHVKPTDPGVLYNLWVPVRPHDQYVIPGPPVYKPSNGGTNFAIEHRKERGNWNCVLTNANWCARALPRFTDEASCWASVGKCWSQLNTCYNTAPATGSAGCHRYEKRCERFKAHCHTCGAARNCHGVFPH